jgi:hypothetical protein
MPLPNLMKKSYQKSGATNYNVALKWPSPSPLWKMDASKASSASEIGATAANSLEKANCEKFT